MWDLWNRKARRTGNINIYNLSSVNGEILIEIKEKQKRTEETLRQYVTIQQWGNSDLF